MYLAKLKLLQFKNYAQANFDFSQQVNCMFGPNGVGKTNILDAIYYLALTKSYFNLQDQQNIKHAESFFVIEGIFIQDKIDESVRINMQNGKKKSIQINNNEYSKLSEHIGHIPLTIITPNDIYLINEGSEERRKFLDGFISQLDKIYLNHLLVYNRTIDQRNKLLKNFFEFRYFDKKLLETYNQMLSSSGAYILEKREIFLTSFTPIFKKYYKTISNSNEEVEIIYETNLDLLASYLENLKISEQDDLRSLRTNIGIHKDDLVFQINNYPIKKFGSQGQQKSFIIALKLAQFDYLKQSSSKTPLLLLDDIFEKLDEQRLNTLMTMISEKNFGQIFITDTHEVRLKNVFDNMNQVDVAYFNIEKNIY
jgi:DNA replication and repair protein RecF